MLSKRAMRKRRRRLESDAYAETARFWRNLKSADRMAYDKPINRQASRELTKPTTKGAR